MVHLQEHQQNDLPGLALGTSLEDGKDYEQIKVGIR